MIKKRKKICPVCKRSLWLRDFYKDATGMAVGCCKECARKQKRDWYNENRKKPDGVFYDKSKGRLMEHKGTSKKIYWDGDMLSIIRRCFPCMKNEEVAEMCGVSTRTLVRKARELGLRKDMDFMLSVWEENRKLAHLVNKIHKNSGMFEKGVIPWNKKVKEE